MYSLLNCTYCFRYERGRKKKKKKEEEDDEERRRR
jgi:hypothetical protein